LSRGLALLPETHSRYFANIYETGELVKEATISIFETVQLEGNREVKRRLEFCKFDALNKIKI